ncbi:hypothetical protein A5844_001951 [Enterococcus sp. 10A9_DIV0425]|uniref:Uncharacterized protein n=1 Tax=Candidatus Enterococcus wittei TaxID=1987383 RepID=A0A242JYE7_9ENTE|nr:hypothetical protein [Enterococcus sp. 10A9_DIV0425]OTP10252.1 hypothetical protein A5844_001951 [Enterococcus sp. 10A9_DIV0425]THE10222.1 hypothetical protein E1H99_09830 [Enterococcus hirae]
MAKETVRIDQVKGLAIKPAQLYLFDALDILEQENHRIIQERSSGKCRIQIYDRKQKILNELILYFPLEDEIEEILNNDMIEKKVGSEKTIQLHQPKMNHDPYYLAQTTSSRFKKWLKRLLIAVAVVFVLIFVGKIYSTSAASHQSQPQTQTAASWEQLLKKESYEKALSLYPERIHELIDYLTKKKRFFSLQIINEKMPTGNGRFELAYHHKKWRSVIETQVEHLTKKRQVKLAIAHLQLGQIKEAELLNRHIKNEEVTLALDQAYLQESLAFLRKKELKKAQENSHKIHAEDLKESLQVYIDHASVILDFIALYQEQKDQGNLELWEQRLSALGNP